MNSRYSNSTHLFQHNYTYSVSRLLYVVVVVAINGVRDMNAWKDCLAQRNWTEAERKKGNIYVPSPTMRDADGISSLILMREYEYSFKPVKSSKLCFFY